MLPPQTEHDPSGLPPQDPLNGLLLNITPIDIRRIANNRMIVPIIISICKFNLNQSIL